jgi:hypothetical protein
MSLRRRKQLGWTLLVCAAVAVAALAIWHSPAPTPVAASPDGYGGHHHDPPPEEPPLPDYDLDEIDNDPTYYKRADHRRRHQKAKPAKGKDRHEFEILIKSDPLIFTGPNTTVGPLVVQARPGRPVHFLALDGGTFPNEQNCISVRAGGHGLAETMFTVADLGDYRVAVGSPENDGTATFVIKVVSGEFLQQQAEKKRKGKGRD